jgi:hypothetical protein
MTKEVYNRIHDRMNEIRKSQDLANRVLSRNDRSEQSDGHARAVPRLPQRQSRVSADCCAVVGRFRTPAMLNLP